MNSPVWKSWTSLSDDEAPGRVEKSLKCLYNSKPVKNLFWLDKSTFHCGSNQRKSTVNVTAASLTCSVWLLICSLLCPNDEVFDDGITEDVVPPAARCSSPSIHRSHSGWSGGVDVRLCRVSSSENSTSCPRNLGGREYPEPEQIQTNLPDFE